LADAVILFEQIWEGDFRRRSLERETCDCRAAALGDLDGGGNTEIVAGRFRNFQFGGTAAPALSGDRSLARCVLRK
jgi:hypothetical protein